MILTVTLNTSVDKLYVVERLNSYEVSRVQRVNNTAGGKGLNVSRVVAQLGESVIAMGFAGGFTGQYFESLITEKEIHKAFTKIKAETRNCVNIWDLEKQASTELLEAGSPVTDSEIENFYKDFEEQLPKASVVAISGSAPAGVSPQVYAKLIEICKKAGKTVLVDTSGALLVGSVEAKPYCIKPNTDEMAQLLGHTIENRDELIEAAKKLHHDGIPVVIVSLGSEGALMVCDEGVFLGAPPKITAVNTVGCGDSMIAGFAVGVARGLSSAEQLRLAVAVSAANALSMNTGNYDPKDFDRLFPQVRVEKMV